MCCDMQKVQLPLLFLGLGLGELPAQGSAGEDCAGRRRGNPAWWDESDGAGVQAECSLIGLPWNFKKF